MTQIQDEPARKISSDLDALREMGTSYSPLGWSRQFAFMVLLVCAFVIVVWFGTVSKNSEKPVLFNAGVRVAEEFSSAAWVGQALEQAMTATLQTGDQIRLINPAEGYSAFVQPATSNVPVGAQWVMRAELTSGEPGSRTVVVQLSMFGVGTNAATYTSNVIGSASSINDLAARTVEQILSWLNLEGLTQQQLGYAEHEIPIPAAMEAYGKGLVALEEIDGRAALGHFNAAEAIAPNTAAIHEGLANAWDLLGYAERAAGESKIALDLSTNLTRRRQLELEANYTFRTEAWPRAQQVFGALKEFNPNELKYRLALAETQARQNDADGFANSIQQMRKLDDGVGEDPRIDITEAKFWFNAGDYARCESLSQTAKAKAEHSGDQLMLGEALLNIGICDDTYDPNVLLQARTIFGNLDTPLRESAILRELAKHEFGEGDMKRYLSYLEEALTSAERLGNEPDIAASKNSLGQAYDMHGWLNRGYTLKAEVAEYQRQRNNKNRQAIVLENMSISLFKMGRYDEAESIIDEAQKLFEEVDDKIGIAWLPYRRGQIALRRGHLEEARELLTQALKNSKTRPEGNLQIESTFELGLINYFAGNYDAASDHLRTANKVYAEQKMSASIAESEIALAKLATQRSDHESAQQHLATAEEHLSNEVAYHTMSLRTEQTLFGPAVQLNHTTQSCNRLEETVEDQEHMEYLLRAKVKLVACRALLDKQPYSMSHAMLVAVEEEAKRLQLFDSQLAAGYLRAALLRTIGRNVEAKTELSRVDSLARERRWVSHPIPGLVDIF